MDGSTKEKTPQNLNLEKRHYTNQKNILLENKNFYSTVYKANEEIFYYNLNEHVWCSRWWFTETQKKNLSWQM